MDHPANESQWNAQPASSPVQFSSVELSSVEAEREDGLVRKVKGIAETRWVRGAAAGCHT
jgi:hypothetical protein